MDGERSKRASGEGAIKLNVAVRPSDGATGGLQVRVRTKKRRQSQLRRGFDLGAVRANSVNGLARSTAFPPPLLPLLSCRRRWPDLLSIFRSYADGRGRPFLPSPSVPPSLPPLLTSSTVPIQINQNTHPSTTALQRASQKRGTGRTDGAASKEQQLAVVHITFSEGKAFLFLS